jgi:hypothetical protein
MHVEVKCIFSLTREIRIGILFIFEQHVVQIEKGVVRAVVWEKHFSFNNDCFMLEE